jgi:signal transduction histidine kinase
LKVGTKLSISFLLVASVIVAIGVAVFMNSRNIGESFDKLDNESVPQMISLHRMQTDSVIIYSRALEYTVEENMDELQDYRNEIREAREDFDETIQTFESSASPSEGVADEQSVASITQDWLEFSARADEVLQLVDSKSDEGTVAEARESMELSQEKFASTVDGILEVEQEQNQVLRVGVERNLNASFILIIIGFAAAAIFAVSFGNVIARSISNPVTSLRNALDDLAGGKYDTRILPAPADEIGDLVTHFNMMREQLKEKEKLQKEFLMIASHELRTPIQPILGYSELARRGAITFDKALDVIINEANRLKRLADDIFDASGIEADRMKYVMEDINITQFITEIAEAAAVMSARSNPAVSIISALDIPGSSVIHGDKKKLSQALWNIVNNAQRFTSEGSITLSCSVVEGCYIELKIIDTGVGIPEELFPNLFKKFASQEVDRKANQGTGLGLFIAKGIVEAHRGKIFAARNDARGSVFTIVLPMKGKVPALAA